MLIFIFVGSKIRSSNSSSRQVDISNKEKQQASRNVDNVVGNSGKNSSKVKDNKSMQWSEISDSEKIKFNKELTDMTFTITDIKHYARVIDATNSLEVKTTLTGTIGGLPGTYVIDIPYDKGTGLVEGSHKLVEGDYFTVHVQIGTYNDRKVVGEISY